MIIIILNMIFELFKPGEANFEHNYNAMDSLIKNPTSLMKVLKPTNGLDNLQGFYNQRIAQLNVLNEHGYKIRNSCLYVYNKTKDNNYFSEEIEIINRISVIDLVNSERTNFIYEFNISENRWVLTDTENHSWFLKNQPPTPD